MEFNLTDEQTAIIEHEGNLIVEAVAGCIAGTDTVKINRGGKSFSVTLEELYGRFNLLNTRKWDPKTPTKIRSMMGDGIQLNLIKNVMFSGMKPTLTFSTKTDSVTCTFDHEIFTSTGWIKAIDLYEGSLVAVDTLYRHKHTSTKTIEDTKADKKKCFDTEIACGKYYKNSRDSSRGKKGTSYRVKKQYLIYDAYRNGLTYNEFLKASYTPEVKDFIIINPKTEVLHHIDNNHENNNVENLQLMTKKDHYRLHSKGYSNFGHGVLEYAPITKINVHGATVKTYDIECEGPYHNFLVNNIVVHNSGKTSTLVKYVARRPNKSFLYIVYNKSAKLDATAKFKKEGLINVTIQTAHSLAYNSVVRSGGYSVGNGITLYDLIELFELDKVFKLDKDDPDLYLIANFIIKHVEAYCNSDLVDCNDYPLSKLCHNEESLKIVKNNGNNILIYSSMLLYKMNNREIDMSHDYYLKLFQLTNPMLKYDYILFDEAQDASPVMLDIFKKQTQATLIAVGDSHQQIYSWRYAINALGQFNWDRLTLTNSFRFGPKIARLANIILKWKNIFSPVSIEVKGLGSASIGNLSGRLSRTNTGLLDMILDEMDDLDSIYFEGKIASYSFADSHSLYDVLNLFCKNYDKISSPVIKSFENLVQLKEFANMTNSRELSVLISIVLKHGTSIYGKIKEIKNKATTNKGSADAVFSTVHKSKGLEYDILELGLGFVSYKEMETVANNVNYQPVVDTLIEDLNVLYVAVTRSKNIIRLPEYLGYLTSKTKFEEIKHLVEIRRWEIKDDKPIERSWT